MSNTKLRTLFISEKLGTYDDESTTVMADEAVARGHEVFECLPAAISFLNGELLAEVVNYPSGEAKQVVLDADFEVIHFRPNPPVDMNYLTLLYLLQMIEDEVLILNRPSSIINFPEKIFPHLFAGFSPPTLITSDVGAAENFLQEHGEVIQKPLYEYGGRGIVKLSSGDSIELPERMIFQKFIPEVAQGDKRIFFVNGKAVGAFLRVPQEGAVAANLAQGGSLEPSEITPHEREICDKLENIFEQIGVSIAGIDVIGDYVTEINITSSIGFPQMRELYNQRPEKALWDEIEKVVNV